MPTPNALRAEIDRLMNRVRVLEDALSEISEGRGPFSRDPLTHAGNIIEAMKKLALDALKGKGNEPFCAWTENDDGYHETECGRAFMLDDSGPLAKHGFRFCVYCGKPILEKLKRRCL